MPRIFLGAEFLSKEAFADVPSSGNRGIVHISAVTSPGPQQGKVTVCSDRNLWFIDPKTRDVEKSISYRGLSAMPVDADGDGTLEVMCRGGGFTDVGLYSEDGTPLWTKPYPPARWMSAGDLNRDGKAEFYIVTNRGLRVVDHIGREVRIIGPGRSYEHVEILDRGVNHEPMIIASAGTYYIDLCCPDGRLIRSFWTDEAVFDFRVLWWPTGDQRMRLLTHGSSDLWESTRARIVLLDGQGEVTFEHILPWWMNSPYGVEGTFVRFRQDGPQYLALHIKFGVSENYSVLYLFSLDGCHRAGKTGQ